MIGRINDKNNTSLNKHEISLFDPGRDVTDSPYGGQCLSFLSFHLKSAGPSAPKTVLLTAQYRNHFYLEKLLGTFSSYIFGWLVGYSGGLGSIAGVLERRRLLKWTLILHDMGKPQTRELREQGRWKFHGRNASCCES